MRGFLFENYSIFLSMNFDREKKLIWITSNDIGEQIIGRNLISKGFDIPDLMKITYMVNFKDISDDFTPFVTIDSPYKKIVSQFKRISNTNWSLKTTTKEGFIESFRFWFDSFTKYSKLDTGMYLYLPQNHRILYHSLIVTPEKPQNVPNLGLFSFDNDIFYKDVLRFDQAQLIYQNYYEIFEICDFNPFDFTSEQLTLQKQVDFIHKY